MIESTEQHMEVNMKKRPIRKYSAMMLGAFCLTQLVGCAGTVGQVEQETTTQEEKLPLTEVQEVVIQDTVYAFSSYVEQPDIDYSIYEKRDPIKGLYVTAHTAASKRMDDIIEIANTTEVNAVVIDVKSDDGWVTIDTDNALATEIGSDTAPTLKNARELIKKLKENDIYTIARIVCFKDPYLARNKQQYAIKNPDGSLWTYRGIPWLNPYETDTWSYIVDVAKTAAEVGFDEIQFDYIRFESSSQLWNLDLGPVSKEKDRMTIITEFVDYALDELEPYGVEVSADVFGVIINSKIDSKNLGQNYLEMAKRLDVICPMVYPSHYGPGHYGTNTPDLYPYQVINGSMEDSAEVLNTIPEGENRATVRPWLQAFTASWLGNGNYKSYGPKEMREQIQGAYDAGLEEWIFWNAASRYYKEAFLPAE